MPTVTAYQCTTCGAPGGRFADPGDALDHITANPGHAIATHSDDVIEVRWTVTTDYAAPVRIDTIRAELATLATATGDTHRLAAFDAIIAEMRAGTSTYDAYDPGDLCDELADVAYAWAGLEHDDANRDGPEEVTVHDIALPNRPSIRSHTTTCPNGHRFGGNQCPLCAWTVPAAVTGACAPHATGGPDHDNCPR